MPDESFKVKKGQIIPIEYENREFEGIVIDPNGLGKNQPSIGLGFRMMEKYAGLPEPTMSNWVTEQSGFEADSNNPVKFLKVPSGNLYRLIQIDLYLVLEVSQWVALIVDVLDKPGKVRKATQRDLIKFLSWFAVKGLYADAYALLKGKYTEADSRTISAWMRSRIDGVAHRNNYTSFLQQKFLQEYGYEEGYLYAEYTNRIYLGLFGMEKSDMIEKWELVEGNKDIGRNYIPEIEGIEAVAYCEKQVIELFHTDLAQAHDDAISYAKKKFKLDF